MNRHSQKGSALLIVLGFLSFMVVSAVAFAIWMRSERLPSSALRRNVANRYLVKAALAQAMSRVDDAIRSHPYPGAWSTNNTEFGTENVNNVYRDNNGLAYDWWESRVFMPPDPEGIKQKDGSHVPYPRYAPVTKTVSVLNLEALGYLPPAIANDVRLLARSSWAAQWDYFNFDAGRYAFCAVNVSDMLDISKMAADAPRNSGAAAHAQSAGEKPPPSRFSLAYLFRKNIRDQRQDNFSDVDNLSTFDRFVHTSPGQGGANEWTAASLVSLMDYNLSVGEERYGNFWSPFAQLAGGKNTTKYFHRGEDALEKGAERQPFVTASWFPPSDSDFAKSDGTSSTPLDLSQHQPFRRDSMLPGNHNMDHTQTAENREFWETMKDHGHALCDLDQCTLFDYLDEDDVPLSLAMPCAERVPMITALAPVGDVSVNFSPMTTTGPADIDQAKGEWRETSEANITISFTGMGVQPAIMYPFKGVGTPKTCIVQAFARLVFVGDAAQSGAGGGGAGGGGNAAVASVKLRNNGFAKNFRPLNDAEWRATVADADQFKLVEGMGPGGLSRTAAPDSLVVTLASSRDLQYTPRENIQDVEGCFKDCWADVANDSLRLELQPIQDLPKPILRKVDVWDLAPPAQQGGQPTKGTTHKGTYYQVLLNPFDSNGNVLNVMAGYQNPTGLGISQQDFTGLCQKYTISPYLVTWVRVVQDGKTVDMVPATYEDDLAFNEVNNMDRMLNMPAINYTLGNTPSDLSGRHALPIMRFPGTMSFTYDNANTGTAPTVNPNQWVHKSCYAVDPRFNWAPENWWFDDTNPRASGQRWYRTVFDQDPDGILDKPILDKLVEYEFGGGYDRADRANDPFLFVSNLGYLQSVGELAFLPRISNMKENGDPMSVLGERKEDEDNDPYGNLYNGETRKLSDFLTISSSDKTMPCALAAWKSYQNYRTNPKIEYTFELGANLYRRGLVNGSQGFYVNPYTQSQEVMLAALANTPLNYWVAGTNYTAQGQNKTEFTTFNSFKNYMFSDSGSGYSRMTGRDINKIATFLRRRFEDLASMIEVPVSMNDEDIYVRQKVWEDMFDALDWSGNLENYTVEHVYDRLQEYYSKGDDPNKTKNYRLMYSRGSVNRYSELNHFVRGGGNKLIEPRITLRKSQAVHKDDFRLSADPLRGQYAGDDDDTSCWDAFHDVDRKFLHSYWRDCFANRQQLFLIFVRAESTALGGTGEGTPAQQGGRAVALVWRDPEPPVSRDGGVIWESDTQGAFAYRKERHPHKMRVLFYRQFD